MGWVFLILLVIGAVVWGVDQVQPPPSSCADELGCSAIKGLQSSGVIDEFEFKEPDDGDVSTIEINDNDSFVIHLDRSGYEIEYPATDEDLATSIDGRLRRFKP